jgi:hypothetical protein
MILECLGESPIGVEEETIGEKIPSVLALSRSIPNPFHNQTSIRYQLPTPSFVSLKVYDITGRLIYTLVDKSQKSGVYRVHWDGRDEMNQYVPSGIYFVSLTSRDFTTTKKMILLR